MNDQQTLAEKREEARQEILALKEKTPAYAILNYLDRWFPESISEQSVYYWVLQFVFINIAIILPGIVLALVFHEMDRWSTLIEPWVIALESVIVGLFLAHVAYKLILNGIADYLVPRITNPDDLSTLILLCGSVTSNAYAIFMAFLWVIWVVISLKVTLNEFIGFGLLFITIMGGYLIGTSFQAVFWTMALATKLKGLHYELNAFTPANSEVIIRLSGILNAVTYFSASSFAVITLLTASGLYGAQMTKTFAIPCAFIGWSIIIVQFLIHRSSINGIVETERWTSLNKLQLQMNAIQATEDLSNKDVSERLLRLADLHEKIRSGRAGGFDLKSALSLFSQLMLPLLGLLLGNLKNLMEFFK